MSERRLLYLIVGNGGRYACLYCAGPGYDARVAGGQSGYFPAGYEVFVLGEAAAIVPVGAIGYLGPMPGYLLDHFRGLPPGEAWDVIRSDLPGRGPRRGRKKGNG